MAFAALQDVHRFDCIGLGAFSVYCMGKFCAIYVDLSGIGSLLPALQEAGHDQKCIGRR